jgi:TolA-binding protein
MRNPRSILVLAAAALLFSTAALRPAPLYAQSIEGTRRLTEGLEWFREGKYQEAIASFRSIIFDSPEAGGGGATADAYYWIARSYMALGMLDEAERNLEYFLSTYPAHRLYPDAVYQKGRLLFLQGDPEDAILEFQRFLQTYPGNDLVANALYWVGESLYSLGRLEEAARVFQKVVEGYPTSFKITDARYHLSLIEFKKREDELLKLLKWSHEEALRVTEEYRRREKAYEQAISVYQRRLSAAGQGAQSATRSQLESLQSENASLKERIAMLEAQLSGAAQGAEGTVLYEELERRQRLLETKAEALAVKEALLDTLSAELEQRR